MERLKQGADAHMDTSYAIDSSYWKGSTADLFFDEKRRQIVILDGIFGRFDELSPRIYDKCCPTLLIDNIPSVLDKNIRLLTPKECERLQGFPDDWTNIVKDKQRYRQVGNAVTVNVVEAIGKQFLKTMDIDYTPEKDIKIGEMKSVDEWL